MSTSIMWTYKMKFDWSNSNKKSRLTNNSSTKSCIEIIIWLRDDNIIIFLTWIKRCCAWLTRERTSKIIVTSQLSIRICFLIKSKTTSFDTMTLLSMNMLILRLSIKCISRRMKTLTRLSSLTSTKYIDNISWTDVALISEATRNAFPIKTSDERVPSSSLQQIIILYSFNCSRILWLINHVSRTCFERLESRDK